jgi:hypothetical protein
MRISSCLRSFSSSGAVVTSPGIFTWNKMSAHAEHATSERGTASRLDDVSFL